MYHGPGVWNSENNFVWSGLDLSPYGSGDSNSEHQAWQQSLYLLSHLTSPIILVAKNVNMLKDIHQLTQLTLWRCLITHIIYNSHG